MDKIIEKIERDDVILVFILTALFITLIGGIFGSEFCKEVFSQSWISLPTYLGVNKWVNTNKNGGN